MALQGIRQSPRGTCATAWAGGGPPVGLMGCRGRRGSAARQAPTNVGAILARLEGAPSYEFGSRRRRSTAGLAHTAERCEWENVACAAAAGLIATAVRRRVPRLLTAGAPGNRACALPTARAPGKEVHVLLGCAARFTPVDRGRRWRVHSMFARPLHNDGLRRLWRLGLRGRVLAEIGRGMRLWTARGVAHSFVAFAVAASVALRCRITFRRRWEKAARGCSNAWAVGRPRAFVVRSRRWRVRRPVNGLPHGPRGVAGGS